MNLIIEKKVLKIVVFYMLLKLILIYFLEYVVNIFIKVKRNIDGYKVLFSLLLRVNWKIYKGIIWSICKVKSI